MFETTFSMAEENSSSSSVAAATTSSSNLEHLAESVDGRGSLDHVPQHGFRVGLNHKFSKKGKPFKTPRLHQIPSFIGLSFR